MQKYQTVGVRDHMYVSMRDTVREKDRDRNNGIE